jgi:hypothetical protein
LLILESQIFKIFQSRNWENLLLAYKTYVRPSLEYCSIIWSPYFLKDITALENIQKYFTRRVMNYPELKYCERLSILKLESLEQRRIKFDLIETYKYTVNYENRQFHEIFQFSKNRFKCDLNNLYINFSHTNIRKYWFGNRVCNWWNSLPGNVKNSNSLYSFKKKIENTDLTQYCRGPISKTEMSHGLQ